MYFLQSTKLGSCLATKNCSGGELVMDVVMDMVVLEVEVMRSVMKKREEGSGHRIDDIGVDDNVGDGHDHT